MAAGLCIGIVGDYGIRAFGNYAGGYFYDLDGTGYARVGYANNGIEAFGDNVGGNFEDTDASGLAHVAWGDRGIWAKGNFAGGTFSYPDNVTIWADVAKYESSGFHYTITGNGQKNFIQNHPEDPDKIIVYASLEGDEVGTYTRGTARLTDGEARIALGETFRWTTHPDVGLTAHLTPHGPTTGLYVASLTTEELVVREQDGGTSDVAFDYMVLGLRIGFEQSPAVRDKEREAPIPDPTTVATFLSDRPELAAFTPLDRFRRMEATVRGVSTEEIDLTGSARLKQAILAAGSRGIGRNETPEPDRLGAGTAPEETETEATPRARRGTEGEQPSADDEAPAAGVETFPVASDTAVGAEPFPRFAVSGPVEAGALLVLDPQTPGVLRLAAAAADPNVVGVATEASRSAEGATVDVAVAGYGFVTVRADASYGPIVAGDLLTSSPTPGHVMQATVAVPGTIVGKALESLDAGTGSIRILVTPR